MPTKSTPRSSRASKLPPKKTRGHVTTARAAKHAAGTRRSSAPPARTARSEGSQKLAKKPSRPPPKRHSERPSARPEAKPAEAASHRTPSKAPPPAKRANGKHEVEARHERTEKEKVDKHDAKTNGRAETRADAKSAQSHEASRSNGHARTKKKKPQSYQNLIRAPVKQFVPRVE